MNVSGKNPGADEDQARRISKWHAEAHSALDRYGISRIADGLWYTLAERVDLLAQMAGIEPTPRGPGIVGPGDGDVA